MRNILESLGGKATQAQISSWLLGDVFSEPEFKRWWDATKKLLKKEGHFLIPTKKNDPIELRARAGLACRRAAHLFRAGAPAEGAGRRARPDHQAPSTNSRSRRNNCSRSSTRSRKPRAAISGSIPRWPSSSSSAATSCSSASRNCARSHPDLTLERLIVEEEPRLGSHSPQTSLRQGTPRPPRPPRRARRALDRRAPSNSCRGATPGSFGQMPHVFAESRQARKNCAPRSIAACANIPRPARCFSGSAKTATDWPGLINPGIARRHSLRLRTRPA